MHRAAFVLLLLTASCRTWQPALVTAVPRSMVRARMTDGREVRIKDARVIGDSVQGFERDAQPPRALSLPLSRVIVLRARQFDPVRTTFLVAGATVLYFMIFEPSRPGPCEPPDCIVDY